MEQRWPWLMLCACLWTATLGLMICATVTGHPMVAVWAMLAAMTACLAAGKIIADCATSRERLRVEDIALMVAREAARQAQVRPIRQ